MTDITRAEVCAAACADAFRGDGEIMASPMGTLPALGARLAKMSFEPDLLLTDGVSRIIANTPALGAPKSDNTIEGWMPYRLVFDTLWSGKRHVMMGATQIDQYGNQNIACIGEWKQPKVQLLGVRGAPGNTINHTTSYWVPKHNAKVLTAKVDMVSGVGYDRIRQLPKSSQRFHEIRCVVTNLGVFDFQTPDNRMRIQSLHPGVTIEEIIDNTGFELVIPEKVPTTRLPTNEELNLIRTTLDPNGWAAKEVPS